MCDILIQYAPKDSILVCSHQARVWPSVRAAAGDGGAPFDGIRGAGGRRIEGALPQCL